MLDLDITLLYQAIAYLVLLFILNKILYKPIFNIIKERKRHTEEPLEDAAIMERDVEQGLVELEAKLKQATISAQEERSQERGEANKKEREILDNAKAKAAEELEKMRAEIQGNTDAAIEELKKETAVISKSIAGKILGRTLTVLLLLLAIPFILPDIAEASGDTPAMWRWRLINFALLAVGFYILWKKIIKVALNKKIREIEGAIKEARDAKDLADSKMADYKDKVKSLDAKVESIRSRLKEEAVEEKKRIIAEAELQAVRIAEQAKLTAEQEVKKARIAIREEVALIATEAALEILKKEVSDNDQERLAKEYLDKMRLQ
ncbi:MAG: ATP synthase F0 subunit B [Deltaproteobacteria bacterium]|nr:ATP synthase F0 subunit B [Deltaproteobacteria bacterium]